MMMRKTWMLGFLGFLSIRGMPAVLAGDLLNAAWILWAAWFIHFTPKKE
ncbi:hypothetical protein ACFLRF_00030 [Candidatus Altiarchaeota archaeon]